MAEESAMRVDTSRVETPRVEEPKPVLSAPTPAASAKTNAKPCATADGKSGSSRFVLPASGAVVKAFDPAQSKSMVIAGQLGDPIRSIDSGRVVYAGNAIAAYGNLIVIKHDRHLISAYGNNSKLLVKEGSLVKRGQVIAEMGDAPNGRPSSIFEIRKDSKAVDPASYLPRCD